MYLHTILRRHENEITNRIYQAMKEEPIKGDWIELVKEDLESIDMSIEDEEKIKNMTEAKFKKIVKEKIREVAFKKLEEKKAWHDKVRTVVHTNIWSPQKYLLDGRLDNKDKSILFNLRSKCINEFKDNFHKLYQNIDCPICGKEPDSQEHALSCEVIAQQLDAEESQRLRSQAYSDIFSTIDKQVAITKTYRTILQIRQQLRSGDVPDQAHHGIIVDPEIDS